MGNLTKEQYEHQHATCEGLCEIDSQKVDTTTNLLRCVTCPFCKQVVDALLTSATIQCPECSVIVSR